MSILPVARFISERRQGYSGRQYEVRYINKIEADIFLLT